MRSMAIPSNAWSFIKIPHLSSTVYLTVSHPGLPSGTLRLTVRHPTPNCATSCGIQIRSRRLAETNVHNNNTFHLMVSVDNCVVS